MTKINLTNREISLLKEACIVWIRNIKDRINLREDYVTLLIKEMEKLLNKLKEYE
jgi:hypothetical protein